MMMMEERGKSRTSQKVGVLWGLDLGNGVLRD